MGKSRDRLIDLSHTIEHGMTTYPGLPGPLICDYLSRKASRHHYAAGVEFHIGKIEMVANTGTYVDSPFHRYCEGKDLADLARFLSSVVAEARQPDATAELELARLKAIGRAAEALPTDKQDQPPYQGWIKANAPASIACGSRCWAR